NIANTLTGYGSTKDHFGLKLKYFDGDTVYYNGRASNLITTNSKSPSGRLMHTYKYSYNDLGWLTKADAEGTTYDQTYSYNALGQRTQLVAGGSTITYSYYANTPGSSRLKSITGMGTVQMRYDTLGNLTADTSRQIYSIAYDYRNLPTQSYVAANQS